MRPSLEEPAERVVVAPDRELAVLELRVFLHVGAIELLGRALDDTGEPTPLQTAMLRPCVWLVTWGEVAPSGGEALLAAALEDPRCSHAGRDRASSARAAVGLAERALARQDRDAAAGWLARFERVWPSPDPEAALPRRAAQVRDALRPDRPDP